MTVPRTSPARTGAAALLAGVLTCLTLGQSAPASAAQDPPHLPQWQYDALKLDQAHRVSTGRGVKVAVVDEAFDPRASTIRGADVTLRSTCLGKTTPAASSKTADHGTAMLTDLVGTGRSDGPGGRGYVGVAPGVQVRAYGLISDPSTMRMADCDQDLAAPVLRKAVDDGADIISLSVALNARRQSKLADAVRYALRQDVVVVAAAGSYSDPELYQGLDPVPSLPGVVSAMAVDEHARPWRLNPRPLFPPYGREYPTISAPGVEVDNGGYRAGQGWATGFERTGTSESAPMVAGSLALVKAKYPDATGNQLVQQLIHYTTSKKFFWDKRYGYGIVSPTRMLAHDPTGWPDVNPLLVSPKQAVAKYPMSSYGTKRSTSAGDGTASSQASPVASRSDGSDRPRAGTVDGDQGSGVPVWVWPAAALLLAGLTFAGTRALGRRGGTAAGDGADHTGQSTSNKTREG